MSNFDFSALSRDAPPGLKILRAGNQLELLHILTGRELTVCYIQDDFVLIERQRGYAARMIYRSPDLYRVLRLLGYGKFPKAVRMSTGQLKFEAMK